MIKRLKWNVLYGEDGEDDAVLSDASDDSAQRGSESAEKVLSVLTQNDPFLSSALVSMASDFRSDDDNNADLVGEQAQPPQSNIEDESDQEYAEWRECTLCPGKRFLKDAEVQAHLASRRHIRVALRHDRLSSTVRGPQLPTTCDPTRGSSPRIEGNQPRSELGMQTRDADLDTSGVSQVSAEESRKTEIPKSSKEGRQPQKPFGPGDGHIPTEDPHRKVAKRKAAAKRKLKALKRRKWEKRIQAEPEAKDTDSSRIDEQDEEGKKEKTSASLEVVQRKQMKERKRKRLDSFMGEGGHEETKGKDCEAPAITKMEKAKTPMISETLFIDAGDKVSRGEEFNCGQGPGARLKKGREKGGNERRKAKKRRKTLQGGASHGS